MRDAPASLLLLFGDVPCFCCFFNVKCLVSSALKSLTPFELTALFVTAAFCVAAVYGCDSLDGDVRVVGAENSN